MTQSTYQALRDQNRVPVAIGQSNTDSTQALPFLCDSTSGRVLVDATGGGGGGVSILAATGTVDNSNTVFTFTSAPTIVVVNGTAYRNGYGVTISGTTATLDNPAGTGGDVYGL